MEVVLEQKDAADWIYRGEGAANLVLAYKGSSPTFSGKVLRIEKVPSNGSSKNGSVSENGILALTTHERLIWKETKDLVSAPTREIAKQLYVQHIMRPLLGFAHVDAGGEAGKGLNLAVCSLEDVELASQLRSYILVVVCESFIQNIRVSVSRGFLESVEKNVLSHRHSRRVKAAKVNTLCASALLMRDHSDFPRGNLRGENCICVEIKPKCGFLPVSGFICEENAVKKSIPRFKMHQSLKKLNKEISEESTYDPLDFFSGSKDRVHRAIKALFLTPQNNFGVFLNGTRIFGELGAGADRTSSMSSKTFEDDLKHVICADEGLRTTSFLHLVTEAVYRSGLLDRLLKVQKLDIFDIEGAIHAYYAIVSPLCPVCRDLGDDKLSGKYKYFHSKPLDESLKIVKDYLIAATAKDVSLMISFRPRVHGDVESPYDGVFLESTNQSFDYKASFIDLDLKPFERMAHYYKLDQQIVDCYRQMVKREHQAEKATSIEAYGTGCQDQSNTIQDASHAGNPAGNI